MKDQSCGVSKCHRCESASWCWPLAAPRSGPAGRLLEAGKALSEKWQDLSRGWSSRKRRPWSAFSTYATRQGRPTVVFPDPVCNRGEIEQIERLPTEAQRKELANRLKALDPAGKVEDERIKTLELKPGQLEIGGRKRDCLSYTSDHFELISNTREDIVRRAAVRLEQIYAAYTHFLPPRRRPVRNGPMPSLHRSTTAIILIQSRAGYQTWLRDKGRNILNPAFYDAATNEVVCASELQQLGETLEQTRQDHERQLERIKRQENEARHLPAGEVRDLVCRQLEEARTEIARVNTRNEAVFQDATRQLFRTLYHEAFHAYLANFVYPHPEMQVPRWLNEGLAQIFESAIVEAGELRVGQADPARLARVQRALEQGDLVAVAHLLKARPRDFVVAHASGKHLADRHYLAAWALAHYLTFERRLLGTKALDRYVEAVSREADPRTAFQSLVNEPLPEFEKSFHDYLRRLQAGRDGRRHRTHR